VVIKHYICAFVGVLLKYIVATFNRITRALRVLYKANISTRVDAVILTLDTDVYCSYC